MKKISVVWFKKDLRVGDHLPLTTAIKEGFPVVGFFCFEQSIMNQNDRSGFHGQFMKESLIDLKKELKNIHIPLLIFKDEVIDSLKHMQRQFKINGIYAHEETGNMSTYKRDKTIIKYCDDMGIPFIEYPTNGVVRRLHNRDLRNSIRKDRIQQTPLPPPTPQKNIILPNDLLSKTISLPTRRLFPHLQHGGSSQAKKALHSFLTRRFSSYTYHVGRPHESRHSCGRISPYLTYGNLSLRQVYFATRHIRTDLATKRSSHKKSTKEYNHRAKRIRHLDAFTSRLHRHCHFIQKLESETDYEFENIHPFYDRIRTEHNQHILDARKEGRTGYPLIDAAMRALKTTGRINFRLRATLVSFICNTCLQDRKQPAHHLAKLFVDYEPGIHYPQFQMQAGTTGINQYRIYNPTKQVLDKDADGVFIDTRLPELRNIPMPLKAEPRKVNDGLFGSQYGVTIGKDYPLPIINLEEANRKAKVVLRDLKKTEGFREIATEIYEKHGSRKRRKKT